MALTGIPIIILKEGSKRTHGRDALHNNIRAARIIADIMKSSFGPKGMDKMLVNTVGDVVVSNDGATILTSMDIAHPAAKSVIELAKSQDQEAGDGTSTVVILAGDFLKYASELLESGVHPAIICEGYGLAAEETIRLIEHCVVTYDNNKEILLEVAKTAMATKVVDENRKELAEIVVDAVLSIIDHGKADISNILISKQVSDDISGTKLLRGLVLSQGKLLDEMPSEIENAKILLLNTPLEIQKTKIDAKLNIQSPNQIIALKEREMKYLRDISAKIIETGANVVVSQKSIADEISIQFRNNGILAISNITEDELKNISKTSGSSIQTNISELAYSILGTAASVKQVKIDEDEKIMIEGTPHSDIVSIVIHASTEFVLDEIERSIHDALCVVRNVIEDNKVLTGGGSVEIFVANELREFKLKQPPVIQLVVEAFARAVESIPALLATNAGLDPIEIVGELNQKYSEGKYTWGIDADQMKIIDMTKAGVYEPYRVKVHAIESAVEGAIFLLRIDDIISAKGFRSSSSAKDTDWDE